MNYFIISLGLYFDLDLDRDYFEYNEGFKSYIGDVAQNKIKNRLLQSSNNMITECEITEYDTFGDDEFDYLVYIRIATSDSIQSKEDVKTFLETKVFTNPICWKDKEDLSDGSSSIERYGFEYGPGEKLSNSSDTSFKVSVTPIITEIELSDAEGDIIMNEETTFFEELDKRTQDKLKNQLKDRAAHHRKRLRGLPRGGLCPNPEASRQIFNMISTPTEGPCNNPISGPMGGDVSVGGSMGEELNLNLKEARNPYFTPFGYRDAAKVINRKAPEYYYHLKEIEMDYGDGIKLARYALRKGLPVMVDKNSDPDYPEFAIKGEYHWNDYFYPYPTAHEEDLIAWDGKMFIDEQLAKSILKEEDDEDILRNHGYRQDNLKDSFDIGDRVAHRWADSYNVGTIRDIRENEGIQYQVEWDYSEGESIEWLDANDITHWIDVNEKETILDEELNSTSNHCLKIGDLVKIDSSISKNHSKVNKTGKVIDKVINGKICVVEWEDDTTTREFQGRLVRQ